MSPLSRHRPAPTSSAVTARRDQIQCPRGFVCIDPEIHFEGQPYVKRATDGSVRHLPDYIRGKGSSVINNSSRTARVYQKDNYFGRPSMPCSPHLRGCALAQGSPNAPSPHRGCGELVDDHALLEPCEGTADASRGMRQRCYLEREATSGRLHLKTLDDGIGDAP
ncbi:peptidase inhibitor family I36 protein [Streptomyces virginiae]|uniref:peptidase inhibitor family I36 protein n=1 Tax=Streptomyces virginiae TaxID=1961 RepID=UPI003797630D